MTPTHTTPKKSLGQHFLTAEGIVDSMVTSADVTAPDTVLEVGPGRGILTKKLLATGARVLAVEKDAGLIPLLEDMFAKEIAAKQLLLIHKDVLKLDLDTELAQLPIASSTYKLVANIPYYITGQIIRMFLETSEQPQSMTLLVQKEVAERVVARDGKESLLSLSVKAYGTPTLVRTVSPGSFNPRPTVDSAILHISDISRKKFIHKADTKIDIHTDMNEKTFFEILHLGFAHKRKQLLPNLAQKYQKSSLVEAFEKTGIDIQARAEDVELEKWLALTSHLAPLLPTSSSDRLNP